MVTIPAKEEHMHRNILPDIVAMDIKLKARCGILPWQKLGKKQPFFFTDEGERSEYSTSASSWTVVCKCLIVHYRHLLICFDDCIHLHSKYSTGKYINLSSSVNLRNENKSLMIYDFPPFFFLIPPHNLFFTLSTILCDSSMVRINQTTPKIVFTRSN